MADCSSMYPHSPRWGLGVHVENVCTYPQPPPELKNVLKYFTQNVFYIILKYWKCLFNFTRRNKMKRRKIGNERNGKLKTM